MWFITALRSCHRSKSKIVVSQSYQSSVGTDEALSGHIEGPELEAGLAVGTLAVAHLQSGQRYGVSDIINHYYFFSPVP